MSEKKFLTGAGLFLCSLIIFLPAGECAGSGTFSPGEELNFRIIYLAMPAGTAKLRVEENTKLDGVPVYHFKAEARSSTVFSLFYRVRDRVESFVDITTFLPLRFEKHLREGPRYKNDEITAFDHTNSSAETEGKKTSISEGTQDVLSSLYYLRSLPLDVGKSVFVNVNADEKNYRVEIKVLRKEIMKKWGKNINTIVVQPVIKDVTLGGIMKEKGNVLIWLSDDEKKIPLFIEAKVVIGHLNFVLLNYNPGEEQDDKDGFEKAS